MCQNRTQVDRRDGVSPSVPRFLILGPICRASFAIAMFIFAVRPAVGQTDRPIAQTSDITDGSLVGRAVGHMTVMKSPCCYGTPYHYQINSDGELAFREESTVAISTPAQANLSVIGGLKS
jgi:hypothetical protein